MLSGRTIISNYLGDYQKDEEFLPEDELIDRLYSNKSKFSVDFTIPRIQHRVRQNYRMSLEELLPIKERLRQTDWLIDQIVYRLYNLTNEEIDLVEGRTKM
jgi:deoxyadenosine/deoxycytidine kinase